MECSGLGGGCDGDGGLVVMGWTSGCGGGKGGR